MAAERPTMGPNEPEVDRGTGSEPATLRASQVEADLMHERAVSRVEVEDVHTFVGRRQLAVRRADAGIVEDDVTVIAAPEDAGLWTDGHRRADRLAGLVGQHDQRASGDLDEAVDLDGRIHAAGPPGQARARRSH